jgi:hypothetical protein
MGGRDTEYHWCKLIFKVSKDHVNYIIIFFACLDVLTINFDNKFDTKRSCLSQKFLLFTLMRVTFRGV